MDIDRLTALLLGNVPVIGLVLAFVLPLSLETKLRAERLLGYVLLLGLGLPLLWLAWGHLVPLEAAAPLARELGLADLAMGLVACVAVTRPLPFKGAIVWTLAIARGGDAASQIREMTARHEFALGEIGSILWWDVLAPLAALVLLVSAASRRRAR